MLPTNEARARLNQIAATFDRAGAAGEPITFGSHRRPQAVIVPWELWRQLASVIEDMLDVATARTRLENAGKGSQPRDCRLYLRCVMNSPVGKRVVRTP